MSMAALFSYLGALAYEYQPWMVMICFSGAGLGFVGCWHVTHPRAARIASELSPSRAIKPPRGFSNRIATHTQRERP